MSYGIIRFYLSSSSSDFPVFIPVEADTRLLCACFRNSEVYVELSIKAVAIEHHQPVVQINIVLKNYNQATRFLFYIALCILCLISKACNVQQRQLGVAASTQKTRPKHLHCRENIEINSKCTTYLLFAKACQSMAIQNISAICGNDVPAKLQSIHSQFPNIRLIATAIWSCFQKVSSCRRSPFGGESS